MLNKLTIVIIYSYENFIKFYVHKERICQIESWRLNSWKVGL